MNASLLCIQTLYLEKGKLLMNASLIFMYTWTLRYIGKDYIKKPNYITKKHDKKVLGNIEVHT